MTSDTTSEYQTLLLASNQSSRYSQWLEVYGSNGSWQNASGRIGVYNGLEIQMIPILPLELNLLEFLHYWWTTNGHDLHDAVILFCSPKEVINLIQTSISMWVSLIYLQPKGD